MKKTLMIGLPVVLVLILAYLGAGYYAGQQALEFHYAAVTQLNGINDLEASVVSFNQGLFRSRALIKLTLFPLRHDRSISFNVVDTIYYGPFVFLHDKFFKGGLTPVKAVIRTQLAPDDPGLKKALEKVPALASSEMLTVLSLGGGGVVSHVDIPSFQSKFTTRKGEPIEIKWGGLTSNFHLGGRSGDGSGVMDCPLLLITGRNGQVRMDGMRGRFDSHAGMKGLGVGASVFSIRDIEAVQNGQNIFKMESLDMKAQSGLDGGKINGSIRMGFKKIDTAVIAMGPFTMDMELKNLDAAVLAKIQKLAPALQGEKLLKNDSKSGKLMKSLAKLGNDLIAARPVFELKQLDLRTSKGDLNGKARLAFDSQGKDLLHNPLAILTSVDASTDLSMSQALFFFVAENMLAKDEKSGLDQAKTDARQLADRLISAKYMVSASGSFKASASYQQGALTINGNRLGLSNLH